eukprot:6213305-Pleurochrysis_carterae.AAC.1
MARGLLTPRSNGGETAFRMRTFSGTQINSQSAIYRQSKAAEERILRAEHELRQRCAGRRHRDLGADSLPRAEKRQLTTWRRTWRSEVRTGSSRTKAIAT